MAATSVMQPKDVSFGSHFYVYTVILPNLSFVLYKCIHPIYQSGTKPKQVIKKITETSYFSFSLHQSKSVKFFLI